MDTLQFYFDACSSVAQEGDIQLADEEEIHSELVDGFGTFEDPEDLPASAATPTSPTSAPVPASSGTNAGLPASPQQTRGLLNRFLPAMFTGQRAAQAEPDASMPPPQPKNGLTMPEVSAVRLPTFFRVLSRAHFR